MTHALQHPLAPGVAVHRNPEVFFNRPSQPPRTPAQILRANFGRRPLRCDEGPVTINLAAAQRCRPLTRARERYQEFLHADSGESFIEWLRRRTKRCG